jgi:outer membrane lipoprotein-sorting protein
VIRFSRPNRRWVVPGGAVLGVLAVGFVPTLVSSAGADTPNLPALTPAELLAKVQTAKVDTLSGTVSLTSNLGLPSLGSLGSIGGPGSAGPTLISLLSGTHTAKVWADGPDHLRVATMAPMAETNWVRNGTDLWRYDSSNLTATHATLPAGADHQAKGSTGTTLPDPAHENPAAFAQQLLDRVTPTTNVSVSAPRYVADHAVYQLVLEPKSTNSTVGAVVVSIDSATGVPLDLTVNARSNGATALEFGFTKVRFDKPAASTFTFTPPPGARVEQAGSASELINPTPRFRRFDGPPGAQRKFVRPAVPAPPTAAPTVTDRTTTIGEAWDTVALVDRGAVPVQLASLLNSAPKVTVGSHTARLVTSTLLNALVLDDGRIAIGAVSPAALQQAVAATVH